MPRMLALLRAVNVGGRSRLPMADLRRVLDGLGFASVTTVLQSGNAVFTARAQPIPVLEGRIEQALLDTLGLAADVIVRSADQWQTLVDGNPFTAASVEDPSHMLAMCLKAPATYTSMEPLEQAATAGERIHLVRNTLYIVYPHGIHRSRLTGPLIERTLGTRGTARNWNTVLKLQALL